MNGADAPLTANWAPDIVTTETVSAPAPELRTTTGSSFDCFAFTVPKSSEFADTEALGTSVSNATAARPMDAVPPSVSTVRVPFCSPVSVVRNVTAMARSSPPRMKNGKAASAV